MQAELSGINSREEVAAQGWLKQQAGKAEEREPSNEEPAPFNAEFKDAAIPFLEALEGVLKPFVEAAKCAGFFFPCFNTPLAFDLLAHKEHDRGGNDGAGEKVGRQ